MGGDIIANNQEEEAENEAEDEAEKEAEEEEHSSLFINLSDEGNRIAMRQLRTANVITGHDGSHQNEILNAHKMLIFHSNKMIKVPIDTLRNSLSGGPSCPVITL